MRAFPRPALDDARVRVYLEELADLDPAVLAAAVRTLIRTRTSDWLPAVGAIREVAAELVLALPSEEDALAQIAARIAWTREPEADRGERPEVHPVVARAVAAVGGFHALRTAENASVVRGQFGRLYREARGAAVRDCQVGAGRRALSP